jgi:hypothetical protein
VKPRRPSVAHGGLGKELQNLSEAVDPFPDEPEPSDVETIASDVETIASDVETIASDLETKLVDEGTIGKDDDVQGDSVATQRCTVELAVFPEGTLECP